MEFLVRLVQVHEAFREAELRALAELTGIHLEILEYRADSPFCVVRLDSVSSARALISRAIIAHGIYELWGHGKNYESLHEDVKSRSAHFWKLYETVSFRFKVESYQGKRSSSEHRQIINSFEYVGFKGPIMMTGADQSFMVFEEYNLTESKPKNLWFGRLVGKSDREAITKYDLKKRNYISTTSMDAELALVTANLALAAPGKIFFDPFMGTGGFPVACAHYGAHVLGSDIDGRSIRGKGGKQSVLGNFQQYHLTSYYVDGWTSDLTNTPLRVRTGQSGRRGTLDGIVCDPPYGVREGLKVLGRRDGRENDGPVVVDGELAHNRDGFIFPKRPYSFDAMLEDICDFAALMLVDGGRLSMWMPTANEDDKHLSIPSHPCLFLVSECIQPFNRWSRRLLTYQRLKGSDTVEWQPKVREGPNGRAHASDLNEFRKKYFEGFREFDYNGQPKQKSRRG
ncbi:tRNA guanosine-2'-O-methyltransferase [Pseudovirgaria hyperparasitica]|uniref:tRNA (guanine(10)-N(2))-methyltransferase n=1 Tax=Pseudovirgaria hyperparasitica TaxID=470096 RepID=A0A6A6WG11_9PEZI|nr:tRNA guanosine-2'-O-methyltransferase [Pseudovirgaria hyperparasitica]KAF2761728.1 tRNA guanosine-2'-O-methyltransferase [Pseudovirgaria hyperparasitica]